MKTLALLLSFLSWSTLAQEANNLTLGCWSFSANLEDSGLPKRIERVEFQFRQDGRNEATAVLRSAQQVGRQLHETEGNLSCRRSESHPTTTWNCAATERGELDFVLIGEEATLVIDRYLDTTEHLNGRRLGFVIEAAAGDPVELKASGRCRVRAQESSGPPEEEPSTSTR